MLGLGFERISGVVIACVFSVALIGCIDTQTLPPERACSTQADCGQGEVCGATGTCIPDNSGPQLCESHGDCTSQQICNEQGLCENKALCYNDQECGSNQWCNLEDYCFAPADAPYATVCLGLCESKPQTQECSLDEDCALGEFCQITETFENPDDPSMMPAVMPKGFCVEKPPEVCHSHADCGKGRYCDTEGNSGAASFDDSEDEDMAFMMPVGGFCKNLEPNGCTTDSDCETGSSCSIHSPWGPSEQGTCSPSPTSCLSHDECGPSQYCSMGSIGPANSEHQDEFPGMPPETGTCVDLGPNECASDSHCTNGETCQFHAPHALLGQCETETFACKSDGDCEWNEECAFIIATDAEPAQENSGVCIERKLASCYGDWDCGADEYCEYDTAGWKSFGCQEHHEPNRMPPAQEGVCLPNDGSF